MAKEKKRSKVNTDDVFTALNELGFEKFEDELKEFMKNYNSEKEEGNKMKMQMQAMQGTLDKKRVRDNQNQSVNGNSQSLHGVESQSS